MSGQSQSFIHVHVENVQCQTYLELWDIHFDIIFVLDKIEVRDKEWLVVLQ